MTEQQREDELLTNLLQTTDTLPDSSTASYQPPISRREEQRLLREANQAGTPTLAPRDVNVVGDDSTGKETFASEMVEFVRRHPVPTLLAAVGIAYVFTRRRSH